MGNTTFQEVTFDSRERLVDRTLDTARTTAIPWYVWCLAAAVVSDAFGGYWDISWHISIGATPFGLRRTWPFTWRASLLE